MATTQLILVHLRLHKIKWFVKVMCCLLLPMSSSTAFVIVFHLLQTIIPYTIIRWFLKRIIWLYSNVEKTKNVKTDRVLDTD